MGPLAAKTVNGWVDQASASGELASVIGGLLVLFAASRLVGQLRSALNHIFKVDEVAAAGFRASIRVYIRRRLFAFGLVAASGPVLLAIFASRALLSGLHELLFGDSPVAGVLVQGTQIVFSVVLVTLMSVIVFRFLPDVRWHGAPSGSAPC